MGPYLKLIDFKTQSSNFVKIRRNHEFQSISLD